MGGRIIILWLIPVVEIVMLERMADVMQIVAYNFGSSKISAQILVRAYLFVRCCIFHVTATVSNGHINQHSYNVLLLP